MTIPLSVLTGFLGSGKTTLLRRVLADPAAADTAVVVNEFGAVGLDHLLLAASPDEVLLLPSGCLCCAVRQDLVRTLYDLLDRRESGALPPFRQIAIEMSGLAEPAPILYTLAADARLEHDLRLDTVLAVVDGLLGLATLDRHGEATAQVVVADRLVISKTDLAAPSGALLDRLEALNPGAAVARAGAAEPAAALLFGAGAAATRRPARFWSAPAHAHGIGTLALRLRRPMSRLDFARALGGLARARGEDLLRVKGLIAFADVPDRPAAVHAVQHTLYPPEWLEGWPDADRTSRLVFITRAIDPAEILSHFAAADPQPIGPEPGEPN